MRGLQGLGRLEQNSADLRDRKPLLPCQHALEGLAPDQGHQQPEDPVGFSDVVHGNDVGILERAHRFGLTPEARDQRVRQDEVGPQHLERQLPLEPEIAQGKDLRIASPSQQSPQLVVGSERAHQPLRCQLIAGGREVAGGAGPEQGFAEQWCGGSQPAGRTERGVGRYLALALLAGTRGARRRHGLRLATSFCASVWPCPAAFLSHSYASESDF